MPNHDNEFNAPMASPEVVEAITNSFPDDLKHIDSDIKESTNSTTLSDQQVNEIAEALSQATPEEVEKMKESAEKVDEDIMQEENEDGYIKEINTIAADTENAFDAMITGSGELPESDMDIYQAKRMTEYGEAPELDDEAVAERAKENISQFMDLSDEELLSFATTLTKYRKDPDSVKNLYNQMPSSIRSMISQTAIAQGVPITRYNEIAKTFMDEFVSQAEMDEAFIDIEKSLNEALAMPSISDLYYEHTNDVMYNKIPEIIDKIKDTEPEHAEILIDIKNQYESATNFDQLYLHYNTVSKTRKMIRETTKDYMKACEEFNRLNMKSQFKMPDCTVLFTSLHKILEDAYRAYDENETTSRITDMDIRDKDLQKFIILFCRSAMMRDANKLSDAAYMYYGLRNLSSLGLTNEAKTDSAVELINNICDVINFIRQKEANYASTSGKRSNKRKNRK